jgi:hypothetical protein
MFTVYDYLVSCLCCLSVLFLEPKLANACYLPLLKEKRYLLVPTSLQEEDDFVVTLEEGTPYTCNASSSLHTVDDLAGFARRTGYTQ